MKLQHLEIAGFKSFVDPVELSIAGGITAIVGPNGCGKSNLADAITWVLGEQSAKSLRGSRMEDVIFAGSSSRKPIGMAEVSLTLEAAPGLEAAEDGRLTIGRRVFRSGQSQYRLNGKVVRLKEIKDLLMDTGLGIRAYSVIEQGKIGMILSGKPQERRKLLEEAAGITRYKARKRIAELKLEEASANLLRLDDIISEVERSLRSLKRQASAARRFKAREAEYRQLRDQVLRGRWYLLRLRLDEHASALAVRGDREAALSADLIRDEAALAEARERLDAKARGLAEKHQRQADLAGVIEGRQAFLEGARDTVRDIGERLIRGAAQGDERQARIAELASTYSNLDARTVALVAEREEAARVVAEDDARIAEAQRQVETAQGKLEEARRELLAAVDRLNRARAALQGQEVDIERGTLRGRFLAEERARLDGQLAEAEAGRARVAAEVEEAEAALAEQLAARREGGERLDQLLAREAALSEERRQLESRLASLGQRQTILGQLSAEHAERRRGLVETLAAVGVARPRFLADTLRPAAGWERSVDHYLGELADAVVIDADADGVALATRLAAAGVSGCFLQPSRPGVPVAPLDDPAIVEPLAAALGLDERLAAALPPAYLVERTEDAARLAAAHPGTAFISRDRMWALGGLLRVQSAEAAPGVLAREQELESIGAEIPRHRARVETITGELETIVATRSELAAELQAVDERCAELRRQIAVAGARVQDLGARLEKLIASRDGVAGEQAEIESRLAAAGDRQDRLAAELASAEEGHRQAAAALEAGQREVEQAKERREALREEGAGRRGRLELLDERLESHGQEALRLRRQVEENEQQQNSWAEEAAALEARRAELATAIAEAESELQAALERRAVAQEATLAEQAALDREREVIEGLEVRVRDAREGREALRGELEALRVEEAGLRQRGEHLAITYRDELGGLLPGCGLPALVEPEESDGSDGSDESDESDEESLSGMSDLSDLSDTSDLSDSENSENSSAEPLQEVQVEPIEPAELTELEAEMARAKGILDRIGPVNVLAAEEYDEQLERGEFLTGQRTDVAESVRSLKHTIREINETSSERFRATFEVVNQAFGESFTQLFRGGEAEMRLLDEDDVLESGIEIVARPPGKRAQNIMLLSGGEKALTAIALLFALFRTKPSPFCILDEVDAPLDDVNILRFVEVLREMATETQFLIITHNKLTMEVASTLYGVTMEEKGISKLVSVEMDQVDEAREAVSA